MVNIANNSFYHCNDMRPRLNGPSASTSIWNEPFIFPKKQVLALCYYLTSSIIFNIDIIKTFLGSSFFIEDTENQFTLVYIRLSIL
jgi:hypothetical protein